MSYTCNIPPICGGEHQKIIRDPAGVTIGPCRGALGGSHFFLALVDPSRFRSPFRDERVTADEDRNPQSYICTSFIHNTTCPSNTSSPSPPLSPSPVLRRKPERKRGAQDRDPVVSVTRVPNSRNLRQRSPDDSHSRQDPPVMLAGALLPSLHLSRSLPLLLHPDVDANRAASANGATASSFRADRYWPTPSWLLSSGRRKAAPRGGCFRRGYCTLTHPSSPAGGRQKR